MERAGFHEFGEVLRDGYCIYSSDAGVEPSANTFILAKDTPADSLVASLTDKVIILSNKPTADTYATFHPEDKSATWLESFGSGGEYSLLLDSDQTPDKALQTFRLSIKMPWGLADFESSNAALESAFGSEPASKIEPPGIVKMGVGPMLFCGLVKPASNLKTTVKQAFEYVGLDNIIDELPSAVRSLTATLDVSKYSGKRNALWFNPVFYSQATLQLTFQLDAKNPLQDLLTEQLPRFRITEADIVCRKILSKGETSVGLEPIDNGSVFFAIGCAITAKNTSVQLTASIHFFTSGFTIVVKLGRGIIDHILKWLAEILELGEDSIIHDEFPPRELFPGLEVQDLMITFSNADDEERPKLSSVRLDFEVAGDFGKVDNKKPVFLISYDWMKKIGGFGSLRGQLWNSYDTSPERLIHPSYNPWEDLIPYTENPGTAINLETLVPGETIEIPQVLPSHINRLFLELSQTGVSFGATVNAEEKPISGSVPQPYLGQVQLDAGYSWGKYKEFNFSFEVLAGIEPPEGSSKDEGALIEGSLSYESKSE